MFSSFAAARRDERRRLPASTIWRPSVSGENHAETGAAVLWFRGPECGNERPVFWNGIWSSREGFERVSEA